MGVAFGLSDAGDGVAGNGDGRGNAVAAGFVAHADAPTANTNVRHTRSLPETLFIDERIGPSTQGLQMVSLTY